MYGEMLILDVQVFLRHSREGGNPEASTGTSIPGLRYAAPGMTTIWNISV
jgi:hypothetical protein